MSTRCNVIVMQGMSRLYLYRHHDGYPAVCGAAIVDAVKAANTTAKWARMDVCVRHLLGLHYDPTSVNPTPRAIYEVTDDVHGDVEYVYEIVLVNHMEPQLFMAKRNYHDKQWTRTCRHAFSLAEFVVVVNGDRRGINKRLSEKRKESPQLYGECDDYPMID